MKNPFKRLLTLPLIVVMTFCLAIPAVFASYIPKDDPKSNHSSNIVLLYTGYYNPDNYQGEHVGDYTKEKLLPYVGYLDEKGKALDSFYDSFIMLTTTSPNGGSLHRWYSWVPNSVPGRLEDWQWAMDRPFEKKLQLDALDQAVAEVGQNLGDKEKKVNVFLTMPFPDPQSKDFGDFNRDGVSENLESLSVRNELVKWYVDTMTTRFQERNYRYLTLAGFYWLQEDLDTTVTGEAENVRYASEYLNAQGMRLGWIPWSGAGEKMNGNRFGFDFTLVQPNHYFQNDTTIQRIEETALQSKQAGQGVELEFDQRAITDPEFRQRQLNYLIGGVKYEYMNDSLLAYYQDVYGVYDLYHHSSPEVRALYTDLYRFAKGIYTAPTGNLESYVRDANGNPLAGATVTGGDGYQAVTQPDGKFTATGQTAIRQPFTISKVGYISRTMSVNIVPGQTIHQDIVLQQLPGGPVQDESVLADFNGDFNVGGNGVVTRSFTTNVPGGSTGSQVLKVDYPAGWGPVRAYIDSGSNKLQGSDRAYVNYLNTDWSAYDALSMEIYNPTGVQQTIRLEIMYDAYSWATSVKKAYKLEPQKWNTLNIPIQELKDAGANVKDIIRLSMQMNDFPTGTTLYFDNVKLLKYAELEPVPDYIIQLPSKLPTIQRGATWKPEVTNATQKDGQGQLVIVPEARFESTDENVLSVAEDGVTVTAKSPGKALLIAKVGNIAAGSVSIDISGSITHQWNDEKLKLEQGKQSTLQLNSTFENGYRIPWKDATYEWTVSGDAVQLENVMEGKAVVGDHKTVLAVRKGVATVSVTLHYNGQTFHFTRMIQVKDGTGEKE